MNKAEHYRKLEHMYATSSSQKHFTPIIKVTEGAAEVSLAASDKYFHSFGAVHGYVYFKLLDDAAVFAANSLVADGRVVLTVSFNMYLVRPVSSGEMRAFGKAVHQSENIYLAESTLVNAEGKELARASGAFARGNVLFKPEFGYKLPLGGQAPAAKPAESIAGLP